MYADAWHALQDVMNFTYVVKLPNERAWGNLVNGSWTGMIGTYWSFKLQQI